MKITKYEKERMFSILETMIQMLEESKTQEEHTRRYCRIAGATFILSTQNIITNEERIELENKTSDASLKALRKIFK